MIRGLATLLSCQLAGEAASRELRLPVPGPVLGLVLLFAALVVAERLPRSGNRSDASVGPVADALLQNLALLFVPAGVGVIKHLDLLAAHGVAIAAALIGSTALTLVVTVFVFVAVAAWTGTDADAPS